MKQSLEINGEKYKLLKKRIYNPVYVYRGKNKFLRIGSSSVVGRELALHRRLLACGFPLAKILGSGKMGNQKYFIEESLGDRHFGQIFAHDCRVRGSVSTSNFEAFRKVLLKFASAQLSTRKKSGNFQHFHKGINLHFMNKESPKQRTKTALAIKLMQKKLQKLPFVQTHGDLGPFNIYPKGVIDIESLFEAPIGYDLATAIFMTDFFPVKKLELQQIFRFTRQQKKKYIDSIDYFFQKNNLPKFSGFLNEFILARCLWTTTRMEKWPKIRSWRFLQYERLLSAYLSGKDLIEFL
jgi:hypothetical protein